MSPPNSILLVAHAPLASALRQCALHVFPESAVRLAAVDVPADAVPRQSAADIRSAIQRLGGDVLVLADIVGATPCNIAQRVIDGKRQKLIAGASLPMLLRAITYLDEPLDMLVARATAGGTLGVISIPPVRDKHLDV